MRGSIAVLVGSLTILATGCASKQKTEAESNRQVRLAMAGQLEVRGDWGGAFQIADGLTREDPNDAIALLIRGKALRKQGMPAEAEGDLRRVLVLAPKYPEAHAELGVLCDATARSAEALEHHREASKLAPGSPRYLNNLGFALVVRGKQKEAIPLLEEALRAEPGSAILRNNLGFALAASGDFGRAAEQFRLGGGTAEGNVNLGFAYERSGNLPQAYDAYLRAVRLVPGDVRARANLEAVTRQLGREPPPELAAQPPRAAEKGGG